METSTKEFTFIHFNDVYNVLPNNVEPVGGAARFVHMVKSLKEEHPGTLLLFSGDIFSPSVMSTIFKGEQMIPVMDELQIDLACVGNHDYDFGIERLEELIGKLKKKIPWLLSNLFDRKTEKPVFPGTPYHILDHNGMKIGFMGLIEYDWVCVTLTLTAKETIYKDFVSTAKDLVEFFKKNNCDLIVALTHMRNYNDVHLSEEVPEIDLILGGHDHEFFYKAGKGNVVIKSGTDFRELTFNKVKLIKNSNKSNVNYASMTQIVSESKNITTITKNKATLIVETNFMLVTSKEKEDDTIAQFANFLEAKTEEKSKQVLVNLASPVDARFSMVRNSSLPINNFITDLMRIFTNCDCTIVNSGSLRTDSIIKEGELTYGSLKRLMPNPYPIVRLRITGNQIWKTLENGVSKYPALEGRFPMVSGITFTFDPSMKSLNRIDPDSILINGKVLDLEKEYIISCREFIYLGYDGYEELTKCAKVDKADLENLFNIVMKFLEIVSSLKEECFINNEFSFIPGVFGFDLSNKHLIDYLRQTVIFRNHVPYLEIGSAPRINVM